MKPHFPIAVCAGAIAAIVFALAFSGSNAARLVLMAFVALPIALAGFTSNARTAMLAASFGTLVLGLILSIPAAVAFAVTLAFPTVLLVYLALLNRDTGGPGGAHHTEWYPVGRITVAGALLAGTIGGALFMLLAGDMARLKTVTRQAVEQMFKGGFAGMPGSPAVSDADIQRTADVVLYLLPGVSATCWMAFIFLCLWLAARLAWASGQLVRTWPDFAAIQLPAGTPLLFSAALAGGLLLDGVLQLVALGYAGALYAVYVLLGLAIIHYNTRGLSWRGPLLAAVYFLIVVLNSGATLLVALVGLADSFTPLRRLPGAPSNDN